ncbi:MAG: Metal-dependent hydrolase, beta-lactamase superfamily II [uncultured Campylobacterales bacterium]|uniref:Metal-dependent hydrolase, beta-lactamase superfamily II n=1 Tax=uncultured Campylobacterales bacterium TaxID=352960 RepID=A0A6S6SWK1_9BACT|nr:MAG: Metal-dependent hydrolase, beta-lactamase superfamily II [uncultured Campylobacterales bacterium]
MNYEIDFLPINEEQNGDAILLRWQENARYKVMVIDGGTKQTGEKIVSHIKKYYNTSTVDYLVSTHPTKNNTTGLSIVLQKLNVLEFWTHRPWNYTQKFMKYIDSGKLTKADLKKRLEKSFAYVKPLEKIANEKGIPIYEPFQGAKIGIFEVLSPSKRWYLDELISYSSLKLPLLNKLLPSSIKALPFKNKSSNELVPHSSQKLLPSTNIVVKTVKKIKETISNWIEETLHIETLKENVKTTHNNESSVILYAEINNRGVLLTASAGTKALKKAYKYKKEISENLKFIQIPNHGNKNNVSPSILNKILGKKAQEDINKVAYISVSRNSSTLPHQSVINAFIRRGCDVLETKGSTQWYYTGTPDREDFSESDILKFKTKFQED